jgi:glucose 1-dehydrogenase
MADQDNPRSAISSPADAQVLQGQKALVTGANSGIDRGIALALAEASADIVVNYVSGEEAAQQVSNVGAS